MVMSKLVYGHSVASYKQKYGEGLQRGEALGKKNFKIFFLKKGSKDYFFFLKNGFSIPYLTINHWPLLSVLIFILAVRYRGGVLTYKFMKCLQGHQL